MVEETPKSKPANKKPEKAVTQASMSASATAKQAPKKPVPRKRIVKRRPTDRRGHPLLRRIINITAIIGVVILLLVFLGLPNLVTYQPAFCGQCHKEVHSQWNTSTHAKFGCMECHVKSGFNNLMLSRIGLLQRVYLWINPAEVKEMKKNKEKPIGFVAPPPNEVCLPCHEARKRISPSGDIIIPHQSHIKIRKLDCVGCHENFVCSRIGKKKALVTMESCYRCHNGRRATTECTACHTEKGAPPSHREKWKLTHGSEAIVAKDECLACHSKPKDFCKNCHDSKPESHVAEFAVTHAATARLDRSSCLECHDEQATCAKCHGESGQAHEPNWRGVHPAVARNGIRDCFVCHSKYHCNMCHTNPT
jgi:hypothetical protein